MGTLPSEQCLSVLVPAYNEAATIERVLDQLLALDRWLKEIIVVDDASSDATTAIVRRLAERDHRIQLITLDKNQGKTGAVREALAVATGRVVIFQDADLEYDPAEIPSVIAPILQGHADVVYGSRFLAREAARVSYFYHFLANKLLTFCSNLLTNRNMSDIETCYKAFRREVIQPLTLTSRGYGMEVEITALVSRTQARIYEVPISYQSRSYEEGKKIGLMDGIMALYYIGYYNLVATRRRSGREYIWGVDAFLSGRRSDATPADAADRSDAVEENR